MASQTITGPDLQYTQDNQRCYAYSGEVVLNNSTETLLEFLSPSGYLDCVFNCTFSLGNAVANKMIGYHIYFNDIIVLTNYVYFSTVGGGVTDLDNNWPIIIPPFTRVKIQAQTQLAANLPTWGSLTGRVYESLPVRN